MDCGDNSCMFAETKGGMRTNGGCRCLENLIGTQLTRVTTRNIQRRVLSLSQRLYRAERELEALRKETP